MDTPQLKNPCPGGHEIDNFGRPFLGHHNYILSLSVLYLGVEKKILKEIMHFHNIWPRPSERTPAPGVMKYTIMSSLLCRLYLVCLNMPWNRKENF